MGILFPEFACINSSEPHIVHCGWSGIDLHVKFSVASPACFLSPPNPLDQFSSHLQAFLTKITSKNLCTSLINWVLSLRGWGLGMRLWWAVMHDTSCLCISCFSFTFRCNFIITSPVSWSPDYWNRKNKLLDTTWLCKRLKQKWLINWVNMH